MNFRAGTKILFFTLVLAFAFPVFSLCSVPKTGGIYEVDFDVIGSAGGSANPSSGVFSVYQSAGQASGYAITSGFNFEVSSGFISVVDDSPPDSVSVNDGTGTDIPTTDSLTELSANWSASADEHSGIVAYRYAIGTAPGATDTLDWTSAGTATGVTATSLTLSEGATYHFSVQAENGSGLFSVAANSDGQKVETTGDSTPPQDVAYVNDGTGADTDITTSSTTLFANWAASSDPETGIARYWYSVGTTAGASDVVEWTDNTAETSVSHPGLSLENGRRYFFSVRAENGVGLLSGAVNSDGQVVSPGSTVSPGDWHQLGTCKTGMTFNVTDVFGTATVQIVIFDNGGYFYETVSGDYTLERGRGYFIISPDSQVVLPDIGTDLEESSYKFTFENEGWNLFANPFCNPLAWGVTTAGLVCDGVPQDDLKHRIYHYKQNREYTAIGLYSDYHIIPWMAYWIDTPEPGCELMLQNTQ